MSYKNRDMAKIQFKSMYYTFNWRYAISTLSRIWPIVVCCVISLLLPSFVSLAAEVNVNFDQAAFLERYQTQFLNGLKLNQTVLYMGSVKFVEGESRSLEAQTELAVVLFKKVDKKSFSIIRNQKTVEVLSFPLVFSGETSQLGAFYTPRKGSWVFKSEDKNPCKAAVILGNVLKLDIAYQDSRMTMQDKESKKPITEAVHYGLSGPLEDVKQARAFLADYLGTQKNQEPSYRSNYLLNYRPDDQIILVRLGLDADHNFFFEPILHYSVADQIRK